MGKVLDQLGLTAWLPAAMLVGSGAPLIQLRWQGDFDLGGAVIARTAKPLGILVVLLFALVLATLVSRPSPSPSSASLRATSGGR
jgi:hypothetical protein